MLDARRSFVKKLSGAAGALMSLQDPPIPAPRVKTPVNPPEGAEKREGQARAEVSPKARLVAQEKELRETVEQLYARVGGLRTQLAKTSSVEVFSVAIYKQSQEIERLAKRLKTCARG